VNDDDLSPEPTGDPDPRGRRDPDPVVETRHPSEDAHTATTQDRAASPGDDRRIGPYRLLQKIGEGGMGIRWPL